MKKILFTVLVLILFSAQAQSDLLFYRVDTLSSKIFWKCDKHDGTIKLKDGGFVTDTKQQILGGKFIIDMHSIKDLDMDPKQFGTAVLIFENTLKNEFFGADKYPYALFDLQQIKHLTGNTYELTGDFTLHGITNCIQFKADITFKGNVLKMKSERFAIDRTDWGIYRMSPKRPYPDDENGWTVPDKIEIQIDLKAVKE